MSWIALRSRSRADWRGAEQRGETLIEILFTVFIMSTVLLSLLGLLLTVLVASASHRGAVAAGNQVTTVSETIDRLPYVACGAVSNYSSAVTGISTGYTGTITSVRYLQSKTAATAQYVATCPGGNDQGTQLITVRIQRNSPPRSSATIDLVKRNDTCPYGVATQLQPNQKC